MGMKQSDYRRGRTSKDKRVRRADFQDGPNRGREFTSRKHQLAARRKGLVEE